MSEEPLKYPTIEEYKNNLIKLFNYDFNGLSYQEIYDLYFDHALVLQSLAGYLVSEKINGRELYRVRPTIQINEFEDLSLIQTFSYPPPSVCKNNGRANIKHKSVFYCTDNITAAIKESNVKENEECYLSFWELNTKRDLKFTSYLPASLPKNNYWGKISYFYQDYLLNSDKKNLEYKLELRKFITDKFINEESPYHLTSFIANENLYSGESKSDVLIYPSVKTFKDYTNYAFHPNVVNEHLKINKILHVKVKRILETHLEFYVLEIGHLEDDKINWKTPTEQDKENLKTQGFYQ